MSVGRKECIVIRRFPLVLALFVILAPLTQQPARAQSIDPSTGVVPATATAKQRQEVVGLRTQTSRTYLEDGQYVADISAEPVNYRGAHGAWQPIDNTLEPSSTHASGYQNTANQYTV